MRAPLRLIGLPSRLIYAAGLGDLIGGFVLLLTTRGRRTGLAHVTPLQYEVVGDDLVVASVRGTSADWYRNVLAHPYVVVQVGRSRFSAVAEPSVEPAAIADFLELRRRHHPWFVGAVMRLRGVPAHPDRAQLERYASGLAMVGITPLARMPERSTARERAVAFWRAASQDA